MTKHAIFVGNNQGLRGIGEESIHLTVTSPPYVTTKFVKGQDFRYDEFIETFGRLCQDVYRVTVAGGRFALNVADIVSKYRYEDDQTISRLPLGSDTIQAAQRAGFRLLERFIWDKGFTRNFGGPLLGSYPYPGTLFNNNYFEYVYILKKPGKRKVAQDLREQSRLEKDEWRRWTQQWWRIESETERVEYHSAVFPVEVPYRLIRMYSFVGDTILDPYIGTGSTMIAANLADRNSLGFEIDDSCKLAISHRVRAHSRPLLYPDPVFTIADLES